MVVQVIGFYKLYVFVLAGNDVGETVDSVDEHAGKKEIRENDNPFET